MYKANNVVNLATKATKIRGKSHRSKNLNYSQWKKRTKMLLHTHSTVPKTASSNWQISKSHRGYFDLPIFKRSPDKRWWEPLRSSILGNGL